MLVLLYFAHAVARLCIFCTFCPAFLCIFFGSYFAHAALYWDIFGTACSMLCRPFALFENLVKADNILVMLNPFESHILFLLLNMLIILNFEDFFVYLSAQI